MNWSFHIQHLLVPSPFYTEVEREHSYKDKDEPLWGEQGVTQKPILMMGIGTSTELFTNSIK